MKAFSKEWWLELSRYLERDKCWIWRDEPAYFKKLEKYNDDYIEQIIDYCFKRYAEAYHLEQMEGYDLDCAMIAERNERERILGIIEELSFYDDIEKAHILIEMELIEKIKG